jgi:predicted aspartyl protease
MVSRTIPDQSQTGEAAVGKVTTRIEVRNADDVRRAARGELPAAAVRTLVLDDVLCDTGATTLCLSPEMVEALGLPLIEEVDVSTAAGTHRTGVHEDAKLTVMGRTRTVECLRLPGEGRPLLGVIPLEQLGLELDLQRQELRALPDHGPDTYLTIL